MNNKITLPELVDAIAELTNTSKRVSELFLKELFGGDEIDFSDTLDALNEMTQLVEATEYIRGRYPHWDEESDEVYRFYMTVRRRFNKQRQ
jgi:hypothetical protein